MKRGWLQFTLDEFPGCIFIFRAFWSRAALHRELVAAKSAAQHNPFAQGTFYTRGWVMRKDPDTILKAYCVNVVRSARVQLDAIHECSHLVDHLIQQLRRKKIYPEGAPSDELRAHLVSAFSDILLHWLAAGDPDEPTTYQLGRGCSATKVAMDPSYWKKHYAKKPPASIDILPEEA